MKEKESCVRQDSRSWYEYITEVLANNEQRKELGSNEEKVQEKFRTLHINKHEICVRNILKVMQSMKVRYYVAHIILEWRRKASKFSARSSERNVLF